MDQWERDWYLRHPEEAEKMDRLFLAVFFGSMAVWMGMYLYWLVTGVPI